MKKIITFLTLAIISTFVNLFAGDIPETFLHSNNAQMFFAEVLAYHPNKKVPSISLSPVAIIKGDVKEGTMQTFTNPNTVGDFNVQVGKVYLFTYFDDANPLDIFEVTTYNTKTLKIKHTKSAMWKRFEKYLNEGKYGDAKIESFLPYKIDFWHCVFAIIVCALAFVCVCIINKRKKQSKGN